MLYIYRYMSMSVCIYLIHSKIKELWWYNKREEIIFNYVRHFAICPTSPLKERDKLNKQFRFVLHRGYVTQHIKCLHSITN
jgi:hypothetical protein